MVGIRCLLCVAWCLVLDVCHCLLYGVRCFGVCCLLCAVCCVVCGPVLWCLVYDGCCLLFVDCSLLVVVCRLQCVFFPVAGCQLLPHALVELIADCYCV